MDPSEFEGTVAREDDALGAGALEELYSGPQFIKIDLSDVRNELHLSIYNLREQQNQYEEVSIAQLCQEMQQQAAKVTEMKEEYLQRRKQLTAAVKSFSATHLSGEEANASDDVQQLRADCKRLIAQFKSEFDFLAQFSKFAEASFIGSVHAIQELPDPVTITSSSLQVCVRADEALGKAHDQLEIADSLLNGGDDDGTSGTGGSLSSAAIKALNAKHVLELQTLTVEAEHEQEALKESYLSEMSELRSSLEQEIRTREMNLRSSFEVQHMEQQRSFERTIQKKDDEINTLLQSLEDVRHSRIESEERSNALDAEVTKRREAEEKWRAAMVELSDSSTATQELSLQLDRAQSVINDLRTEQEHERRSFQESQRADRQELQTANAKVHQMTLELATRPPADLTALLEKLGSIGVTYDEEIESLQKKQSEVIEADSVSLRWSDVEALLLKSLSKSDADATHCRVKEHETAQRAAALQDECSELKEQLQRQNQLTTSLERDLTHAHQAMQASNAAMKKQAFSFRNSKRSTQQTKTAVTGNESEIAALIAATESSVATNDPSSIENMESSVSPQTTSLDAPVMEGGRILQAVQEQRDRYLRSLREVESEVELLRSKNERLQDEQLQLRNENLELYRRLRTLRVGSNVSGMNDSSTGTSSSSSRFAMRSRKSIASEVLDSQFKSTATVVGDLEDQLEAKYMNLHEADISPFNVQNFDKQLMMSRLNIFEKMLAYINRNIMQDRWARHAFLVYLALLHGFALAYVWQVLNPQLIDEVDAHLKAKWSAQTMSMEEHPDI